MKDFIVKKSARVNTIKVINILHIPKTFLKNSFKNLKFNLDFVFKRVEKMFCSVKFVVKSSRVYNWLNDSIVVEQWVVLFHYRCN